MNQQRMYSNSKWGSVLSIMSTEEKETLYLLKEEGFMVTCIYARWKPLYSLHRPVRSPPTRQSSALSCRLLLAAAARLGLFRHRFRLQQRSLMSYIRSLMAPPSPDCYSTVVVGSQLQAAKFRAVNGVTDKTLGNPSLARSISVDEVPAISNTVAFHLSPDFMNCRCLTGYSPDISGVDASNKTIELLVMILVFSGFTLFYFPSISPLFDGLSFNSS